uniref:ARAD1B02772p n=1 Tax=Blastobotrys adeninivorans TaxID=409370 RepID=A0A060T590_BLAAD
MPVAHLSIKRRQNDAIEKPPIVKTPSGVALIEIQGTINVGSQPLTSSELHLSVNEDEQENGVQALEFEPSAYERTIGRFDFSRMDQTGEVVLDIGHHQRLRGKVVKLKNPLALLQMNPGVDREELEARAQEVGASQVHSQSQAQSKVPGSTQSADNVNESVDIPVLEIITHKISFTTRPEPIVYANSDVTMANSAS